MHDFTGGIEGPEGATAWFAEGLTVYYTAKVPMKAGLTSIDDFLREVNGAAKSYYTNPGRNMSAAEIVKVGFSDERIRHVPYARGFLYFADLDAKIRDTSGGKRKLDDVFGRSSPAARPERRSTRSNGWKRSRRKSGRRPGKNSRP